VYGRLALEHVGPEFTAAKTGGLKDDVDALAAEDSTSRESA
jgi:hypothetical protein